MSADEKPLHVQVAEALGWHGAFLGRIKIGSRDFGDGVWEGFPPGVPQSIRAWPVPRYNTDWAAAGPLIERLKIDLEWRSAQGGLSEPQWEASRNESAPEDSEAAWEPTPLIAVCHLILALKAAGKL